MQLVCYEIRNIRPHLTLSYYLISKSYTTLEFTDIPIRFWNKQSLKPYYVQHIDIGDNVDSLPDIMKDLNIWSIVNGVGNPKIAWE